MNTQGLSRLSVSLTPAQEVTLVTVLTDTEDTNRSLRTGS